ncbi:MAG TPA: hypothetical protein DCG69_05430 [Bacteroidales bacterium]|nr:hypothetical protein [Bacteroidales bacterium]
MLIYRLLLSLIFVFPSVSIAQTAKSNIGPIDKLQYICTYQLDYIRDSTDQQKVRMEEMLLFIGETVSKFQSRNSFIVDTLVKNRKTEDVSILLAKTKGLSSGFRFQIYKNYPEGNITSIDKIEHDFYLMQEPMTLFKWKILEDTATYLGYHCQKAFTYYAGRKYEAWFTSEIPISEGPYKFNGLPGLIVKIKDTRNHYSFELISFVKSKEQSQIVFPEMNYIKTNGKAFMKARVDYVENSVERMAQRGIRMNMDSETQKETVKSSRNNYIEIYN